MDRQGIKQFLRQLEIPNTKDEGAWVMSSCPLAAYTHDKGSDRRFSFGISVHDADISKFHCFTCHKKGTLSGLLLLLEKYTGEDYSDLREEFDATEEFGPPLPLWEGRKKSRVEPDNSITEPLPDSYLLLYEPVEDHKEAVRYLSRRKINRSTAEKLQIMYDPEEQRIVFPVFDTANRLWGFVGRSIIDATKLRVKDYFGIPKKRLLLGSHLIGNSFVVLVEGPFDYAVLRRFKYPALATLGTAITNHKVGILKTISKPVYLLFDNDRAGEDAAELYAEALRKHVPVFHVPYLNQEIKDPAQLDRDDLRAMFSSAELV